MQKTEKNERVRLDPNTFIQVINALATQKQVSQRLVAQTLQVSHSTVIRYLRYARTFFGMKISADNGSYTIEHWGVFNEPEFKRLARRFPPSAPRGKNKA